MYLPEPLSQIYEIYTGLYNQDGGEEFKNFFLDIISIQARCVLNLLP